MTDTAPALAEDLPARGKDGLASARPSSDSPSLEEGEPWPGSSELARGIS